MKLKRHQNERCHWDYGRYADESTSAQALGAKYQCNGGAAAVFVVDVVYENEHKPRKT